MTKIENDKENLMTEKESFIGKEIPLSLRLYVHFHICQFNRHKTNKIIKERKTQFSTP